jgi:hypothetical protein
MATDGTGRINRRNFNGAAAGPALLRNNLVSNPGRGVIWINEPYDNLIGRSGAGSTIIDRNCVR